MKIKKTATSVARLHPAIEYALDVVDRVWYTHTSSHYIVTGFQEEGHSTKSRHYGILGDTRCRAFDIRAKFTVSERDAILDDLRKRLAGGLEFDIIDEGDHLHIEYDPK